MRRIRIINSERPQAIGDCLSAFPAVRALADRESIVAEFSCQLVRPLFAHPNAWQVILRSEPPDIADTETFDVQQVARFGQTRGMHLAQSWFAALGLTVPAAGPYDFGIGTLPAPPAGIDIALAPFSASDGDRQKTWSDMNWIAIVDYLQQRGHRIGLLCGPEDVPPAWCDATVAVLQGLPLRLVASLLQVARCVLTVDNGMSWLAQAVRARHVLLQPSNHPPWWTHDPNPQARNLPDVRTVPVMQVLDALATFGI